MKKIIILVMFLLMINNVMAYSQVFNPFTGKLDYVGASPGEVFNESWANSTYLFTAIGPWIIKTGSNVSWNEIKGNDTYLGLHAKADTAGTCDIANYINYSQVNNTPTNLTQLIDDIDYSVKNVNHSNSTTYWDGETSQADLNVNHSDTCTMASDSLHINYTDIDEWPADGSANGNFIAVLGDTLTYRIPELVYDLTPQLGGLLDAMGFSIINATDFNGTGELNIATVNTGFGDAEVYPYDTLTDEAVCTYETTNTLIDCETAVDSSGDCGAGDICGGGHTHSTYLTDVVSDTTPQLGGNLDTNGFNITYGDNDRSCYGDSNDFCIYYNGTNGIIEW